MLDEEFIQFLRAKDLQDEYRREISSVIKTTGESYESKRDELVLEKQKGIELDKWHRNILNSCIFPFTEAEMISRIGYHFVRASPLHELKVTNFDFLIFNPHSKIAVFGEAKGSMNDETKVVSEAKARAAIVDAQRSYMNSSYLNADTADYEFVIGVPWAEANRLAKCVQRRDGGMIVWQSGFDFRTSDFRLGIFVPSKEEGRVSRTMMHHDDNLNRALANVRTSNEFKTFFIESHILAKLTILTIVDAGKPEGIFGFEDLFELVRNEIGYLDQDTVRKETNLIMDIGLRMGFIKEEGANAFRIGSRSKKAKNRFDEIKQKWIDWSLDQERLIGIEEKRKVLQVEFTTKRQSYGFLD